MQARGRFADKLPQPRFGDHVNIFKRQINGHAIGLIFGVDRVQSLLDCDIVRIRNDAVRGQHIGMRFATRDILLPKTLVEWDGGIYLAHDCAGAFAESAAPHAIGIRHALCNCPNPSGVNGLR